LGLLRKYIAGMSAEIEYKKIDAIEKMTVSSNIPI